MSALANLCEYASDSDDCDELQSTCMIDNRRKLPVPDLTILKFNNTAESHTDDPCLHSGRVRAFPHIRGNWATHVYVDYSYSEEVLKLIEGLFKTSPTVQLEKCDNFHISLSRTVVLKFHWINTFVESLRDLLKQCGSFELEFDSVKSYCNDEKTRTFVSLDASYYSRKYLLDIAEKINEVFQTFKLPLFYDEPSFHMSILWTLGNKKEQLSSFAEHLTATLFTENSLKPIFIDKINCKIGNKVYQFALKD